MSNVYRDISSKYTVCRVGYFEIHCFRAYLAVLYKVDCSSFVLSKNKLLPHFTGTLSPLFSVLLWIAVAVCTSMLFFFSKPVGIRPFLVSVMLRSIYTIGLGPTLILLGAANVSILLSFVLFWMN